MISMFKSVHNRFFFFSSFSPNPSTLFLAEFRFSFLQRTLGDLLSDLSGRIDGELVEIRNGFRFGRPNLQ